VKQRFILGLFVRDLNDAERQELQTNKGAAVRVVVDGSPAFDADLLVGDMLIAIDGISLSNVQAFNGLIGERRGNRAYNRDDAPCNDERD